jgi:drug/metabolite transporter (DMT)-like permease
VGIFYGLAAALCWGSSDFIATGVIRKIGVLQTTFYIQLIGALVYGGLLLTLVGVPAAAPAVWLLGVGISAINMLGTMLLYRAFAVGTLALVAPVASGAPIVTIALSLLSGERPGIVALVGALLVISGVMLVSRTARLAGAATLAGVPEALGVVFCFGTYFWAVEFITIPLGVFWPVLLVRLVEMVGSLALLLSLGQRPIQLSPARGGIIVVASLLNTLAFVAFNLGVTVGSTAIVATLSSLASAVTVLLAWLILRDRLAPWQWVGVGIILVGVMLVSS